MPHRETADELTFAGPSEECLPAEQHLELQPDLTETGRHPQPAPSGGAAVAALAASLFLLACAYAAFSGYVHSYNDSFAYMGILGAVGSLLAAGIGMCLAASGLRRRYTGRFLSFCAISLALMYGMLLFVAAGH